MSSPFTSYEINSSFTERRKNDQVIDRAIAILNNYAQQYEEKANNCEVILEKLGFTVNDLPEDLRSDLKDIFKDDDGVFNFHQASSKKMVQISANHVLESLQEKYEVGQLRVISSQMERMVEKCTSFENNLQRQLNSEKEKSEKLENKRFEKEAQLVMFNGKLEAAQRELENLQLLSQGNYKLKYSLDELDNLKQEANKLKTGIAVTKTKLNKYNQLPLSEKDALRQLIKLKEELKNVDNEIRNKLS